jgi:catechol 2,3-dioxygenase-like lactoylglutathione lyase family enzyme
MNLTDAHVQTRVPARDLDRARRFYAEKLGLEPAEERSAALLYRCGGDEFAIFLTAGATDGSYTQMGWQVDDIEATVAGMRTRGVVFEEYGLLEMRTVDGIAEIEGNYPSKGSGERAAWFHDSEGNLLGLGEVVR